MNTDSEQIFTRKHRVAFVDTDMAGLVHFTNILRYMEESEYAFLRSVGLSVTMTDERGRYGFPRLSVNCNYLKPARFEDELSTHVRVVKNDGKRIQYAFSIVRDHDEVTLATGEFVVACCRFPGEKEPYPIPIPDRVLEKIPISDF